MSNQLRQIAIDEDSNSKKNDYQLKDAYKIDQRIENIYMGKNNQEEIAERFKLWRSVEMWKSVFSFLGLLLVVVDYEVNQYYQGDRGLSKIKPDDHWTGSPT